MQNISKNTVISFSFHNKNSLQEAKKVACYYCCKRFNFEEIKDFTDGGLTAICPQCGIDSLIPDEDENLSDEFLKECSEYWF